jgi:outer membrane protein TolC
VSRAALFAILLLLALPTSSLAGARALLSIDQAIERALERNPVFLSLKSGVGIAELDLESARSVFATRFASHVNSNDRTGAELGSVYQARISKLMQSGSSVGLGFSNSQYGSDSLSELSVSYTLPFFDNPARDGLLAVDRARIELARRERLIAIGAEELALQVIGAYYDTVLGINRLQLAGSARDLADALARVTAVRAGTGLSSPFDLRRAQLRTAEAVQQERLAAMAVQRHRYRLAATIGATPDEDFAIDEAIPAAGAETTSLLDPEHLEAYALANRTELASMRAELALLAKRARAPKIRMPPMDVTLQVSLVDEGGAVTDSMSLNDPRFGIGFNMALDQAGAADRERRRWQLEYTTMRQSLRALESQVRFEAREALFVRDEARGGLRLAEARLAVEEENFRLIDLKYRAGTASTEEALEAEQSLAAARLGEVEARIAYRMSEYRVALLSGGFARQWSAL